MHIEKVQFRQTYGYNALLQRLSCYKIKQIVSFFELRFILKLHFRTQLIAKYITTTKNIYILNHTNVQRGPNSLNEMMKGRKFTNQNYF